jgi:cytochrome c oxidase subunit 3
MMALATEQRNRIHPHKFAMWVAIASMLMMFAGLTSAYIVKRNQANWFSFELPSVFWYSTAVMLASSVAIWMAGKKFRERAMPDYRRLVTVTLVLGLLFVVLQVLGFSQLYRQGLTLQKNVSVSFLYIIVGVHALHVLGGVVALAVMFFKAFSTKVRTYNLVPVEVISTYWHFIDLLWIYLLVFLLAVR